VSRQPTASPAGFGAWRFAGTWHRYQQLALDAFERDRANGRSQTLIVAPPGAGKTLIGLEVIRRLDAPALVLCPTQTIQRQWQDKQALFGPPSDQVTVLTYQALCQADDPDDLLRGVAERQWAEERARATGAEPAAVLGEAQSWSGPAAARREQELARIVAHLKREAAGGGLEELSPDELLSPGAQRRVDELRSAGVSTIVLDECHHLASLWGALLAVILRQLAPRHILGLTATNPSELSAEQAALYRQLLAEVDFTIPTPAVVREGHLAPYQELVQLCEPLASERDWLAARHERFERLLLDVDAPPAELGLSVWLLARLRERRSRDGAQMSWAEEARRQPRFADAGLRWLNQVGERPPDGAPRGELQRAPLDIEDWVALLSDYALGCLHPSSDPAAAERLAQLQTALGDLGYTVTRQGIRHTGTEVDQVLLNSAAKPLAACDILATELDSRGDDLRAVVLCDSQHGPHQSADSPLALSGGGRGLLAAVGADERVAILRPALITSDTFAVLSDEAAWWIARLSELAASDRVSLPAGGFTAAAENGVAVLTHPSSEFSSRRWTEWVTRVLADGESRLLVGTRGLLAEGWDCPQVNVLVDMTDVAADVSVRQMRGRSLRLDPERPAKLAGNWDVVCVAPELGRGRADYDRFVRRHLHIHAPCEDGTIESGPSHVHPTLSPYGPPDADRFIAINREQRRRAADLSGARERWRIGEPYRAVELDVLVVRRAGHRGAGDGSDGPAGPAVAALAPAPPHRRAWELGPRGAAVMTFGLRRRATLFPVELPLDWAAGAVCDAYATLGELSEAARASLTLAPRPDGWLRVSLTAAGEDETARVMSALADVLEEAPAPRYLVSRLACARAGRTAAMRVVWYPVPSDLARRRDRADAFHGAWIDWCGPAELVYLHSAPEEPRELATSAWETSARRVWC
jgi:superfamily II DNA or RNA helicase